MKVEVNGADQVLCGWFAGCFRPAAGGAEHVIMGLVPICKECAKKIGAEVVPVDVILESEITG